MAKYKLPKKVIKALLETLKGALARLVECDSECASWGSEKACNCFMGEARKLIAKAVGR